MALSVSRRTHSPPVRVPKTIARDSDSHSHLTTLPPHAAPAAPFATQGCFRIYISYFASHPDEICSTYRVPRLGAGDGTRRPCGTRVDGTGSKAADHGRQLEDESTSLEDAKSSRRALAGRGSAPPEHRVPVPVHRSCRRLLKIPNSTSAPNQSSSRTRAPTASGRVDGQVVGCEVRAGRPLGTAHFI